jgi:hypothetical protein
VGEVGRVVTPLLRLSRFESCLLHFNQQQEGEEDRPWPTSETSGGKFLAVGPVLRSSRVTPCAAYTSPAGTCSAIGSPTQAITSGAKPTAPTGSAWSRSRSNEHPGNLQGARDQGSLVTDARPALRRPGTWFDSRQGDSEEQLVGVEQAGRVEDGFELAL